MRFTTKRMIAVMLAAAMSVSLAPGNPGMASHSSAAGKKQSAMEQKSSGKGAGEELPAATEAPRVQFSKGSGTYGETFHLELSYAEDANAPIYYTTDGSDPADTTNANRMLYTTDGITVKDRKNDSNVLAAMDPILFDSVNVKVSKDHKSFESTIEKPADKDVDKCTVIKAVAQLKDGTCSAAATNTYFIGEMADHIKGIRQSVEAAGMDLSVMSISMDAEDLFDPAKGIYVKGNIFDKALEEYLKGNGELWDTETCRKLDANYKQKGKEWERNTHIDYFESNGTETTCELQQDCGIRVQGNYSRSDYQKSFRLYARDEYGKKNFKYGFWDNAKDDAGNTIEKYKKIVLRNGGNCAFTTKFSDSYWQSLIEDIDCDKQHARPCAVYLNGEYWGVYILQDDFCGAYMENKHGIDKDNILIYKGDAEAIPDLGYKLDEGDLPEGVTDESYYFRDLEDFMSKHDDLSKEEDYAAFCELVDKDSALDYFATQVWINNKWDWPGKNWSMWRCTDAVIDPANPYADGKWRFLIYDVEFGGVSGSSDARANTLRNSKLLTTGTADSDSPNFDKPNVRCFALLMTNKEFRDAFNVRLESFSQGMFEQQHALSEAERYGKIYEPILGQFFARFPTKNNSVDNAINGGYASLRCITDFLDGRANYIPTMTKWVRKQFGDIDPNATPTPAPTAKPSSVPPKPTASADGVPATLSPERRDQEIPLEDGSVKILHVNAEGTKVLYTAYRVEGVTYRLKSDGSFSYMAKNAEKLKKKKSAVIADVAVAGGKRYKVTEIEDGALQGLKKLQKVTIGENVKIIGKNAFKNCKKLKQLVITGTKLKKVGKNAFKGTAKKLKISCPNKKKKAYQKLIKKSGLKIKTTKINKITLKKNSKQAEPITMTSLKKEDGSYTDANSSEVVTIASAEELKMLSEYTRAKKRTSGITFRQIADIDGTGMMMHGIGEPTYELVTDEDGTWYRSGEEQFHGTYDGDGKKISNLNIAVTAFDLDADAEFHYYLGLFSWVESATIQNIDLRSICFVDEKSGGAFGAGINENIFAAGIVGYAGGESLISGCSNYADISIKSDHTYVAGICGHTGYLQIQDCHNYGEITAAGEIEGCAAGISRYVDVSVSGCSNAAAIYATGSKESDAYGLFNAVAGTVSDCTNTGTVTAGRTAGADGTAAGISRSCEGQMKRCANSGDISAERAAGVIYMASDNSVFDCSNRGKVSGTSEAGGILATAKYARVSGASNMGDVTAGKWAGGIVAMAYDSDISNAENFARVSSGNMAGGAAGHAMMSRFVNMWNHGEISAPDSAGGIVGSADQKDISGKTDYIFVDLKNVAACVFMNCIHLGMLSGDGKKASVIAHSDKKDMLQACYALEESTDPAHGSGSSITLQKISVDRWKQADFIEELNRNLSDFDTIYGLSMKHDAEGGIQWGPALLLEIDTYEEKEEKAQIEEKLQFQIKDTAGEEYIDLQAKRNGYLAEVVPGRTYEIYRLMKDGSRKPMGSPISLTDGDSTCYYSPYFSLFRAYTDVKGELLYDDAEDFFYVDVQEQSLYYKKYYQEAEEVSLPPDPVKEGYDFAGWYTDPSVCDESMYDTFKTQTIEEFHENYQSYIESWDEEWSEWYGDQYDSAEEFAVARMKNRYGYASLEEFEQHYDEYYEENYRVTELVRQDGDYGSYLVSSKVYAGWTKKGGKPSPAPTLKPSGGTSYPVLENLQQYKDKPGAYVQKKGVIYKVNTKKKTAAVVGVSSKAVISVTVQSAVKTGGVNYKVTAINKKAFTGCKQLGKIRVKGKNLKKVHKKALQGAAKKIKVSASAKIRKLF